MRQEHRNGGPGALATMVGMVLTGITLLSQAGVAQERGSRADRTLPMERAVGELEQVVAFTGSMPTGVTVSRGGRSPVFLDI